MPTVRTYGQRQVATAPLPNVRVPTQAPQAETLGEQVLPLATQLSAQRDAVTRKAELDADEMVVNSKERELADFRVGLLQDPQSGLLNRRGINALGAMPDAQEAWKRKVDEIAGSFKNDNQRARFASRERGHYNQLVEQVAAHTSAEVRKADTETTSSFLEGGLADVQQAPEKAAEVITDARKRLVEFSNRQGWSPETLKLKDALHVSDIHAAAISAFVQRGTYEAAQQAEQYLAANRGALRGRQLDDAEKLVDTALGQGEGFAEADKILGINQASNTLPSVGQQQEEVTPQGTAQQGPATSRADALLRAEAIKDPRARKAATEAIMAHFTRMETAQRLDRQEAASKVLAQMEASGGRLNRASKEYLTLVGHPEEEHILHRQDQLLRPPKDPGDPELFMSHLNMATISPATREHFLELDFTGKDGKGLSTSQRTRLIQMQGQFRGQATRSSEGDAAATEKLRFDRENALLEIGDPTSKKYIEDKAARDAEVGRIKRHYNQLQAAHAPSAPPKTTPSTPTAEAPAVGTLTHAQLERIARDRMLRQTTYEDYVTAHGFTVPKVLPSMEPKTKK